MKDFLRNQLDRYAVRLEELDFLLSREDIMGDMAQYRLLSREHAEVTQIAGRFARFIPTRSRIWLVVSTMEWTPSARMCSSNSNVKLGYSER